MGALTSSSKIKISFPSNGAWYPIYSVLIGFGTWFEEGFNVILHNAWAVCTMTLHGTLQVIWFLEFCVALGVELLCTGTISLVLYCTKCYTYFFLDVKHHCSHLHRLASDLHHQFTMTSGINSASES